MKKENERKSKEIKDESGVGGDVGVKGLARGELQKNLFFFLAVTYSRVFRKRGYRSPFQKLRLDL